MVRLQIGDIIGYKPEVTSSWIAAMVKLGAKQRYTHVMLYLGNNEIIEAGEKGIGIRKLPTLNEEDFSVKRVNWTLSRTKKDKLKKVALSHLGQPYAFHQGLYLFLYKWFKNNKYVKWLLKILFKVDGKYFLNCSEFISRVYDEAVGVDLSPELHDFTAPDDIMESSLLKRIY